MTARLRLRSFWLLLVLGAFFFLSYGLANELASRRAYVPSIVFTWERRVPFLPWTIVPYWSSDFIFAVSLFVCTTWRELKVHAGRLFAVSSICVMCFLAFPLRCTSLRPAVDGLEGWLFEALNSFDKPFNQAPSLHAAYAVILWQRLSLHSRGPVQWAVRAWLVLVVISTMTTYQHHFIDIPTGLLAGGFAASILRDEQPLTRRRQRTRLAVFYLSGAAFCVAIALELQGPGVVMFWPAAALLLVSTMYLTDSPGWFLWRGRSMNPLVAVVAAPYLAAVRINVRCWTGATAHANEIADGVWLGRAPGWFDRGKYPSIVDVAAEAGISGRGADCRRVPMLDLVTPSQQQLEQAAAIIEDLRHTRPTLVCCALGFSRSAHAVAHWMVATGRASTSEEAAAHIRSLRPRVRLDAR